MREYEQDLVRLIVELKAKMYVCGSTKMAKGVKIVISDVLREIRPWPAEDVAEYQTNAEQNQSVARGRLRVRSRW